VRRSTGLGREHRIVGATLSLLSTSQASNRIHGCARWTQLPLSGHLHLQLCAYNVAAACSVASEPTKPLRQQRNVSWRFLEHSGTILLLMMRGHAFDTPR
jgi:hypothetical protein